MSRAEDDTLDLIHKLLAADMLKRLEEGGLEAKDWAAITKFLKDNNVDAIKTSNAPGDAFANLVSEAQKRIAKLDTQYQ